MIKVSLGQVRRVDFLDVAISAARHLKCFVAK
jgi:hypothetical protein